MATHAPDAASELDHDRLSRFVLDTSGVRGVFVRLGAAWRQLLDNGSYPAPVEQLLGECCAAAALFTGHAKVEGRLSIQLVGETAVRRVFAECTHEGHIRGIALHDDHVPAGLTLRDLGGDARLAITIENQPPGAAEPVRYQGLVGLDADTLPAAFEDYFRQSEQLPTRLLLTVRDGVATGLMIQQLPGSQGDEDGWRRASALFDTLGAAELATTAGAQLLHRLFHEDGVRVLASRPLAFGCSCSLERVRAVMASLGREEALAAAQGGQAEVRCEFCNTVYRLTTDEILALYADSPDPGRLH